MDKQTTPLSKIDLAYEFVQNMSFTERELARLIDKLVIKHVGMGMVRFGGVIHDKVHFSR